MNNPTQTNETLMSLAARVEEATGADRELDCLIWCALNGVTDITYPGEPQEFSTSGRVEGKDADGKPILLGWIDPGQVQRNWSSYGGDDRYPNVTASLDAAMTLKPNCIVELIEMQEGRSSAWVRITLLIDGLSPQFEGRGSNLARAFTAACLRAHSERTGCD